MKRLVCLLLAFLIVFGTAGTVFEGIHGTAARGESEAASVNEAEAQLNIISQTSLAEVEGRPEKSLSIGPAG